MTDPAENLTKPCIALMGEFSAGKSTLANLLIGSDPLPVQVVATQLPPVWITSGTDDPFREDLDGNHLAVDIHNLADVPLTETAYIKIFCDEDILHHCDLLDMPGISDPNMASEVWERMILKANGVLWCSHATQAWRQSEAAVWASLPVHLYANSLLLLTRMDKITTAADRDKVVRRVKGETRGLFKDCLPISLLQATTAKDDYDLWLQSGAGEFAEQFAALVGALRDKLASDISKEGPRTRPPSVKLPAFQAPVAPTHVAPQSHPNENRIVPKRVRLARPEPTIRRFSAASGAHRRD